MPISQNLLLVTTLARLLKDRKHPLIGTNSPDATSAALLAREMAQGSMRLTIIGSAKYNTLTDDLAEVFDSAARGIFDAFFVGGGQIDGQANVNLVGLGDYPSLTVRWPGSHGTPLLYLMIPNAVLFLRQEHTRRALVPRVDFISTPGTSEPGTHRPGGPVALVTSLCVFKFLRDRGRFELQSVHPGHTVEEVQDHTGFEFDIPAKVEQTAAPSSDMLRLLQDRVCADVAAMYPKYADELKNDATALLAETGDSPRVTSSAA